MKLDNLDKRIVFQLDQDARASLASIAKTLKVSSDAVEDRVRKLEATNVIRKYSVLLNYRCLGNILFKVFLKLQGSKSARQTVIKGIANLDSVIWLARTYGHWDICFSVAAKTPKDFDVQLKNLLSKFSVFVADQDITITTAVLKYPRNYLLKKPGRKTFHELRSEDSFVLNNFDVNLIGLLTENARESQISIAKKTSSSVAKVRHRIKKLEELDIITGYRPILDLDATGLTVFKVLLERLNYSKEFEAKFKKFCRDTHNITYFGQQLGRYSFEFDAEVSDTKQMNTLLDDLRDNFDGDFRTIETLIINGNYKYFLPKKVLRSGVN